MFARLLSVPVLLSIGGLGLGAGLAELRASAQIERPLAKLLAEASGGSLTLLPARSHRIRRVQMDTCLRAASDPAALVFPPLAVSALLTACQARAASILTDAPTNGAALAVAASSEGSGALDRSWAYAPFEGWLAAHRFALGAAATGTPSYQAPPYQGMVDDAALLIALGQADEVALAYLEKAEFQVAFAARVQSLPPADQRRFLAAAEAARPGGDDGF